MKTIFIKIIKVILMIIVGVCFFSIVSKVNAMYIDTDNVILKDDKRSEETYAVTETDDNQDGEKNDDLSVRDGLAETEEDESSINSVNNDNFTLNGLIVKIVEIINQIIHFVVNIINGGVRGLNGVLNKVIG